jgi:hypothetical protein
LEQSFINAIVDEEMKKYEQELIQKNAIKEEPEGEE